MSPPEDNPFAKAPVALEPAVAARSYFGVLFVWWAVLVAGYVQGSWGIITVILGIGALVVALLPGLLIALCLLSPRPAWLAPLAGALGIVLPFVAWDVLFGIGGHDRLAASCVAAAIAGAFLTWPLRRIHRARGEGAASHEESDRLEISLAVRALVVILPLAAFLHRLQPAAAVVWGLALVVGSARLIGPWRRIAARRAWLSRVREGTVPGVRIRVLAALEPTEGTLPLTSSTPSEAVEIIQGEEGYRDPPAKKLTLL